MAHILRDTKEVEGDCLAGKILHDEMVYLFQRIKALQKKLQVKNEAASEKMYQKALKEINDIAEARYCKNVEKIQQHLKRRGISPVCSITDSNGEWQGIHISNGKPLRSINGRIWSTPDSAYNMGIKRIPGWRYFVIYWTED